MMSSIVKSSVAVPKARDLRLQLPTACLRSYEYEYVLTSQSYPPLLPGMAVLVPADMASTVLYRTVPDGVGSANSAARFNITIRAQR